MESEHAIGKRNNSAWLQAFHLFTQQLEILKLPAGCGVLYLFTCLGDLLQQC